MTRGHDAAEKKMKPANVTTGSDATSLRGWHWPATRGRQPCAHGGVGGWGKDRGGAESLEIYGDACLEYEGVRRDQTPALVTWGYIINQPTKSGL